MDISSDNFLDTLPAFFTQGNARLTQMMVYARIYHPVLPYEYYVLEYNQEQEVFMTFAIRTDDPDYTFFSVRTLTEFLTAHELSYLADDSFVPARLVELFPDYVVPQNEEDVFC